METPVHREVELPELEVPEPPRGKPGEPAKPAEPRGGLRGGEVPGGTGEELKEVYR